MLLINHSLNLNAHLKIYLCINKQSPLTHQLKKGSAILFSLLFLFLASCDPEKDKKPEKKTQDITGPVVIFFNPSSSIEDSLLKLNPEQFYRDRDSITAGFFQLRTELDSLGIKYITTNSDFLSVKGSAIKSEISIKEFKKPWGVIFIDRNGLTTLLTNDQSSKRSALMLMGVTLPEESDKKTKTEISKPQKARKEITRTNSKDETDTIPQDREYLLLNSMEEKDFNLSGKKSQIKDQFRLFPETPGKSNLSNLSLLNIGIENDIFLGTDYYYSNGVIFDLISPVWRKSPLRYLFIPIGKEGEQLYGMKLIQTMFTPIYPVRPDIQVGDRPFASTLYIGSYRVFNQEFRSLRFTDEWDLGIIGDAAQGRSIQSYLHGEAKRPLGWQNQIADDILINYSARAEKGIFSSYGHQLIGNGQISIGTMYTGAAFGLSYIFTNHDDYFSAYYPIKQHYSPKQPFLTYFTYQINARADAVTTIYDATLQGGMFNHDSPYVIPDSSLYRIRFRAEAGLTISFKKYSAEFAAIINSPEFTNQRWHRYGRLKITIPF